MNDTERALALADPASGKSCERDPTFATAIGDERYDDRLPDIGEAGRALSERNRAALEELATIDRLARSHPPHDDGRARAIATQRARGDRARTDRLYMANHFVGPGVLLGDIASIQRTDFPSTWTATTRACARCVPGCVRGRARGRRDRGGIPADGRRARRRAGRAHRGRAGEGRTAARGGGRRRRGRAATTSLAVWRDVVAPAFAGYLDVLRDYLPHAVESNAVTDLPGGDEIYAEEIRSWTTLPLDPRRSTTSATSAGTRSAERLEIACAARVREPGRGDGRPHVGEGHPESAAALVELVEDQVARSWEIAPQWFGCPKRTAG